jgi:hypothetical protein
MQRFYQQNLNCQQLWVNAMEKQIDIGGKTYRLKSSLYSIISYKNTFGTELFSDITGIEKVGKNSDDVSNVINTIFRIFYILHKPFTNQSYDDFLNEFDFDILANQEELTKLSEVIAEVFKTSKNDLGRSIEKR